MMRRAMQVGALCALLTGETGASDQNEGSAAPVLRHLYSSLQPVFQRYYPTVKSALTSTGIEFEHDTRMFLIHVPLKTGEWQEAREIKGPNRRGILCHIGLVEGKYNGAAMLPQTFNDRYFETLVMAVARPDESAYLYIHLSYPHLVDARFQQEFHETLKNAWRNES